jgi:hypothetical protein
VVVKLINTEGLALIGPGSEWFWTALSGLVLAVTFFAIYRQLRLAQSAGAIAQLDAFEREWMSERLTRFKAEVLVVLGDPSEWATVPDGAASHIANFWEKLATLIRGGHIDVKLLWNAYGNDGELWWVTLRAWVGAKRSEMADPSLYEHFEWLTGRLAEMDTQAGMPSLSEEWVVSSVARRLASSRDMIRVEQALRTVIIASPEAVPLAPAATAKAES